VDTDLSNCKWLHPLKETEKADLGKKPLTEEHPVSKNITKQWMAKEKEGHVGTSATAPTESQTAQPNIVTNSAQQPPTVHDNEVQISEKSLVVIDIDATNMQGNRQHLAHEKSTTSFHFALQNVTDKIVRSQQGKILSRRVNRLTLKQQRLRLL